MDTLFSAAGLNTKLNRSESDSDITTESSPCRGSGCSHRFPNWPKCLAVQVVHRYMLRLFRAKYQLVALAIRVTACSSLYQTIMRPHVCPLRFMTFASRSASWSVDLSSLVYHAAVNPLLRPWTHDHNENSLRKQQFFGRYLILVDWVFWGIA
jgi:hypothetical protein